MGKDWYVRKEIIPTFKDERNILILKLLLEDKIYAEIGDKVFLCSVAVGNRIKKMKQELNITSTIRLVLRAIKEGLITE